MDIIQIIRIAFKDAIVFKVFLAERIGKTVVNLVNVKVTFMEMFAINVKNYPIAHHNDLELIKSLAIFFSIF